MKEDKRKIRMFELYKDLYIGPNNYEQFASKFDRAVAKGKAKFMFKNYKGKPYIVDTEYVKFVLNLFETMPHGELMDKANQYKKDEIKLTKEDFEKKQEQYKDEYTEERSARDRDTKIYDADGHIANKKTSEQLKKIKEEAEEHRRIIEEETKEDKK